MSPAERALEVKDRVGIYKPDSGWVFGDLVKIHEDKSGDHNLRSVIVKIAGDLIEVRYNDCIYVSPNLDDPNPIEFSLRRVPRHKKRKKKRISYVQDS